MIDRQLQRAAPASSACQTRGRRRHGWPPASDSTATMPSTIDAGQRHWCRPLADGGESSRYRQRMDRASTIRWWIRQDQAVIAGPGRQRRANSGNGRCRTPPLVARQALQASAARSPARSSGSSSTHVDRQVVAGTLAGDGSPARNTVRGRRAERSAASVARERLAGRAGRRPVDASVVGSAAGARAQEHSPLWAWVRGRTRGGCWQRSPGRRSDGRYGSATLDDHIVDAGAIAARRWRRPRRRRNRPGPRTPTRPAQGEGQAADRCRRVGPRDTGRPAPAIDREVASPPEGAVRAGPQPAAATSPADSRATLLRARRSSPAGELIGWRGVVTGDARVPRSDAARAGILEQTRRGPPPRETTRARRPARREEAPLASGSRGARGRAARLCAGPPDDRRRIDDLEPAVSRSAGNRLACRRAGTTRRGLDPRPPRLSNRRPSTQRHNPRPACPRRRARRARRNRRSRAKTGPTPVGTRARSRPRHASVSPIIKSDPSRPGGLGGPPSATPRVDPAHQRIAGQLTVTANTLASTDGPRDGPGGARRARRPAGMLLTVGRSSTMVNGTSVASSSSSRPVTSAASSECPPAAKKSSSADLGATPSASCHTTDTTRSSAVSAAAGALRQASCAGGSGMRSTAIHDTALAISGETSRSRARRAIAVASSPANHAFHPPAPGAATTSIRSSKADARMDRTWSVRIRARLLYEPLRLPSHAARGLLSAALLSIFLAVSTSWIDAGSAPPASHGASPAPLVLGLVARGVSPARSPAPAAARSCSPRPSSRRRSSWGCGRWCSSAGRPRSSPSRARRSGSWLGWRSRRPCGRWCRSRAACGSAWRPRPTPSCWRSCGPASSTRPCS